MKKEMLCVVAVFVAMSLKAQYNKLQVGYMHLGSGNEIWCDYSSLYFNFQGSAKNTYFWNLKGREGGKPVMSILSSGSVGIGTSAPKDYVLAVKGKIGAGGIEVRDPGYWPDYVFKNDYKLKTLEEVEEFIRDKSHLPGIPSEVEVKEKGIDLGEMNAKLLEKVEELTLYLIEQNKQIEEQTRRISELELKFTKNE